MKDVNYKKAFGNDSNADCTVNLSETLNFRFRVGKMWTLRCQFWKYIFGY